MGQPLPALEKSTALVQEIVKLRKRWGRSAGAGQYSMHDVLDALVVIFDESNIDGPTRAELTKANRQLAAAGAREAGYKKRIAELEAQIGPGQPGDVVDVAEDVQHNDAESRDSE